MCFTLYDHYCTSWMFGCSDKAPRGRNFDRLYIREKKLRMHASVIMFIVTSITIITTTIMFN